MSCMEIKLTRGLTTLVDEEDFNSLNLYHWCAIDNGSGNFAAFNAGLGFLHRYITNCPKDKVVDHINNNSLDNRKENLRICTISQNNMNQRKSSIVKYTSRFKGVCYDSYGKRTKRWKASVRYNNKTYNLGYFSTEEEAAREYNKEAFRLFGKFANLNKIEEE